LKVRNEVSVGALTLFSIVLLILGYNFLKGNDIFSKTNKYVINFENTAGLYPANAIIISGLEVGRISKITLANDGKHKVLVEISLPQNILIPEDSRFKIESLDLLGKKGISVTLGTSSKLMQEGIIYQGEAPLDLLGSLTDQILPIKEKAETLMVTLDTMLKDVHRAIGYGENSALKQTVNEVSATLSSANKLISDISGILVKEKAQIEGIIRNADGVMQNANVLTKKLADNSEKIDQILADLETFTGKVSKIELEETLASAKSALDEVNTLLAGMNNGEGTLGKIVKDENLYGRVDSTISTLNFLLQDLQKNPKRYVSFSLIERKNKE
jgi:phospholipid/cholesterol/gamma-HCH transport system substrate-binding protein